MPEYLTLNARGVFHLCDTGYPCQVKTNFQLVSREAGVLQAQVILYSPASARRIFLLHPL